LLVQIYGLTVVSDAVAVDELGADLIGVVLDEGISTWDSVDEQTAREIAAVVTISRLVALSLSTDLIRIKAMADLLRPAVVHLARANLMPTKCSTRFGPRSKPS
jgi:phosphoribosylanthranilate isomerase